MKTRKGFVSNSSSSSFLVARKVGSTDEELISAAGWLGPVAKELLEFVAGEINKVFQTGGKQERKGYLSIDALVDLKLEDWYAEPYIQKAREEGEADFLVEMAQSLVGDDFDGWEFGYGDASYNEGEAVELMLGNMDIQVKTGDFRIVTRR